MTLSPQQEASIAHPNVTVLGLGPMGTAVAQALVAARVPTTVWNRTAARAEPLGAVGAHVAETPEIAVRGADLVVSVLRDHDAVREVLGGLSCEALAGRAVLNFATSTPEVARATARWASDRDIAWLSGSIMVPTPLIGSDEALLLYSGDRGLFDHHLEVLRLIGGDARYVGDDHGLASLLDTAMLEIFFAGMTAFLHAAAMTSAQGVAATAFLPYAEVMVDILPAALAGLARDVDAGSYPGAEDNLDMELAALEHIVQSSDDIGLDGRLPHLMRDLAAGAVAAGHGGDSWSRVIDLLRKH